MILKDVKGGILEFDTPSDKIYYRLPNGASGIIECKEFIHFLNAASGGTANNWLYRFTDARKKRDKTRYGI